MERNEKDLRLNQRMTAEARARMRLLSQSGAKDLMRHGLKAVKWLMILTLA